MIKIFTSFFLLIILTTPVFALSVAPAKLNLEVRERVEQTYVIAVYNNESADARIKVKVSDFKLGGKDDTQLKSCANFSKISPIEFNLKSGQLQKVRLSILAPAESAGQYKSFIYVLKPGESGENLNLTARIAVPLSVRVRP